MWFIRLRRAVGILDRTRVLVVDDNERYGAMLCRFVASHPGIEVVGRAANGGEAIAMVSLLEPDMVLMDVCMPGIDGIAATRAVTAMRNPAKVILLTAHRSADSEQQCLNAGASGFLRKSDADGQLIEMIRGLSAVVSEADCAIGAGEDPEPPSN
jgi:DNA-binding NarL/FixJ family response regulator